MFVTRHVWLLVTQCKSTKRWPIMLTLPNIASTKWNTQLAYVVLKLLRRQCITLCLANRWWLVLHGGFGRLLCFNQRSQWTLQLAYGRSLQPTTHTLVIIIFANDGLSSWWALRGYLQIYPRCAYTQFQLNHFAFNLCIVYVMCNFFGEYANTRHPSTINKMTF